MGTLKIRRAALGALAAGAGCIGFAPVLVRLSDVGPSATAFYRLLFALPFLWVWMWVDQSKSPVTTRPATAKDFLVLAIAGLFFTADLALWHWSLQFTSVATSTLLTNFAPLLVTAAAAIFLREKITRQFVMGMLIAVGGAGLLVVDRIEFRQHQALGNALAVLTAVFYAGYLLTVKVLRARFRTPAIMAWSGVVSCVSFLVVALLSNETVIPASAGGWLAVIALALISHLGGQALIPHALGHLPASFSSVTLLLQPVVAALLAWVLLKERLTLWQWTGGVIILCGIFLAGRKAPDAQGRDEPENM